MEQRPSVRGLILAGGTGTRLRPFTYTQAKQLLPIANKPVILYAIEALVEAGISEIGVITGDSGDQFQTAIGDGDSLGAHITYIRQEAPLGLAHAVQTGEAFVGGHPFVVFLGDNFLRGGIVDLVRSFRESGADAQLTLKPVPDPRSFGVAELDAAGRPVRLVEKPSSPPSDLAILGIYMLSRAFFRAAAEIKPSARGELEITDALQRLIDSAANVTAHVVEEDWIDTGTPADLLAANRRVLEGIAAYDGGADAIDSQVGPGVSLGAGARLVRSVVIGPAIIGRDAVLEDSRIGPGTSVGDGCRLAGADVAGSIFLEGAVLDCPGVCIRDSIIGRRVRVAGSKPGPELRLIVGDDAEVQLS